MAESIIIHFASATWDELTPWLDRHAIRGRDRAWSYPEADYSLLLYEYLDLRVEYGPEELERLRSLLGQLPSQSLCLELRRSQGNRACDAAATLSADLLRAFPGVVDDTLDVDDTMDLDHYWTLADLEVGASKSRGRFLDGYRTAIPDG